MANLHWLVKLVVTALIANPVTLFPKEQPTAASPELTRTEMEHFLRTAKVIRTRSISTGVTRAKRATLSDGQLTHDAQIQTIDEYKRVFKGARGFELDFRDSYRYNIAAYQMDKLLNLNMVPVSVRRKFRGKEAAFTWWIDDVLMTDFERYTKKIQVPNPSVWSKRIFILRIFDQLISNVDRNLGNVLITKNWRMWLIDHTRSFRLHGVRQENLSKCDRLLLARLQELSETDLMQNLRPHLRKSEVKAVLDRRDEIIRFFEDEIAQKGEAAVLYDYLGTAQSVS